MSPGKMYLPEASMTRAPGGIDTFPWRPTALILLPSITTTPLIMGGLPVQSITVAPLITVTSLANGLLGATSTAIDNAESAARTIIFFLHLRAIERTSFFSEVDCL